VPGELDASDLHEGANEAPYGRLALALGARARRVAFPEVPQRLLILDGGE